MRPGETEWRSASRLDMVGVCLLFLLSLVLRTAHFQNVGEALLFSLLVEPLALPLILLLRPFLQRRAEPKFDVRAILLNALLCTGAALAMTAWAKIISGLTGWYTPTWGPLQSWVIPWAYFSIVFVTWGLAHFWAAAEDDARSEKRRAAAAEAEALKAELHHLRHQLDPHFLFNALNGIAVEIHDDPDAAVGMVRDLGEYLRYSLDQRNRTVTTFASELDAVRSYLDVQKTRFGPELNYRLTADEVARRRQMPSFLLQPLVENAVKHGFKAGITPLAIAVSAAAGNDTLQITVAGEGILRPDWRLAGDPGVGLSVLRRRLELHYPGRHDFGMRQIGNTVTAELRLQGEPCSVS
ncbi:sensor histidine kinase [Rhodoplanes sp.]|uniref:sensor histidine kinase n=1 Tax=Rhodoplanes sp. TaxID=1968906 RepID=UPI0025CE1B81|nr:histidine kinase [Rhodoplanes sp.]